MTTPVFAAVLLAALLHAGWNALVKGSSDKSLGMTAVALGYAPISILALVVFPLPAPESLPYIATSILLHLAYMLCLLACYRHGDLTQTYPLARGSAPMIVALVSVLWLGVALDAMTLVSLGLIGAGIISLTVTRGGPSSPQHRRRSVISALLTGGFIAAYSLNDGVGVRLSGSAVGYFAATALGVSALWTLGCLALRRRLLSQVARSARLSFVIGGNASFIAYVLVVWAFTQAPIALVSALRETSIVFALLIGVGFLGEPLNLRKAFATFLTLLGVVALRLSR
ncbi:EamA-like transporter family protein [Aquimixticola soesokkakensis]|uniref:EamA-like transporter family protein n=1 Tax=Aquimixticola soesokkakensis TaxID=1519096 RepID=A0A1Y5ST29_9RHOB|nr:EamA family transporter [Aquimixticola soesokkakensis]SLN44599.1 EamA-like transporter family protein [Aquimixticola soesokkakensis]